MSNIGVAPKRQIFGASKSPSFACASEIVSCETFPHPMFRSLLPFNQSPFTIRYSLFATRCRFTSRQSPVAIRRRRAQVSRTLPELFHMKHSASRQDFRTHRSANVSCETFTHPMFRSLLPFNQSPFTIRYSLFATRCRFATRYSLPSSPSFSHASRIVSHETLRLKAGF
jgi:hypothetical protein